VPANEAACDDLGAIFGARGYTSTCQCQRFKGGQYPYSGDTVVERLERQRAQAHCGDPTAPTTSGLVAYLDGEPVGWCAVEPRPAYARMARMPVPWTGRDEDKGDPAIWAVTCFVTRAGFRRRGIARALAAATVDHARSRGARALEAYPMITEPGQEVAWGETHVGTRSMFEAAGLREIHRPTLRRVVMRIDFRR
jgi:GNAT superfamily N-acetyltransferase